MLFRQRRGDIVRVGDHEYRIPSQCGGLYNVCLKPGFEDCSCPDFARYGRHSEPGEFACKHLFAALMLGIKRAQTAAGAKNVRRAEAA